MCLCVAFFNVYLFAIRQVWPTHTHSPPRPGHVSLVVCQLSGTPSRPLRGPLVVVLVYSLSHDFAVKCLQNVCLTRKREKGRGSSKACAGFEHDF